jgi:small subunit ribosomal protein S4
MARYRGPKSKIARKFGDAIFGADKAFEKKKYPPGMHGANKRRKNNLNTVFSFRKNKKPNIPMVCLKNSFLTCLKKLPVKKVLPVKFCFSYLKHRLDNVVYRLGIAPSRRAARQLVGHKHITVNGEVVNIPSYTLRPGDVVGVREKSKSLEVLLNLLAEEPMYNWLEWDQQKMKENSLICPKEILSRRILRNN